MYVRIAVLYNTRYSTRMVRIIVPYAITVPYAYGAYETPLVYIGKNRDSGELEMMIARRVAIESRWWK